MGLFFGCSGSLFLSLEVPKKFGGICHFYIVEFHPALLSGNLHYNIWIGDGVQRLNKIFSRLHVDYAAARDDQYEFECKQREAERERRHITQSIKELTRPPRSCLIISHSFLKTGYHANAIYV